MKKVSFLWLCGAVGNLQKPRGGEKATKIISFRKENKGKVRKSIRVIVVVVGLFLLFGIFFFFWLCPWL